MLRTEEEARKCWCPFARTSDVSCESAVNRTPSGMIDEGARCIASKCMAWRQVTQYRRNLDLEWEATQYSPDDYARTVGLCGLAVRPPNPTPFPT